MTYYKRHIDEKLLQWKDSSRRKPLLIRGARQVGVGVEKECKKRAPIQRSLYQ